MSTTSENDASRSPFPLQTPEIHSQGKIDTYCDTQRLRNISSPRRRVLGELSANARQTACSCGTKCVCTLNLPSIRKAVATKPIHAPSKNPTPSAGRQANDCENNAKGLDEKDAHTNRYSNKGSRKRSIDQVDPPRLERSHSSTSRTAPICSTPTGNQRGELIDDTRADEPSSSSETMRTECSFSSIIDYDASTKPVGAGHGIATNVVKGTEEVSSDMCVAHGAAEALLSQRNNVDVTTTARKVCVLP